MRTQVNATGNPSFAGRGEGTRKGTTGGREGAREATLSNVPMSQCKDLGSTEARQPSVDVLMRARDKRWNLLTPTFSEWKGTD